MKNYPNVGRWVIVGELFADLRRMNGDRWLRDMTWKNESALGRALMRHYSALRVLGVEKKKTGGRSWFKFTPTGEALELCQLGYKVSGARLYQPDRQLDDDADL